MSTARRWDRLPGEASLAGLPGLVVLLGGLWWLSGATGLLAGLAVGALWLLVPAVYAVGAGHVLLVALTTAGTPLPSLLPAEAGLLWLLLAPDVGLPEAPGVLVGAAAAALVGAGLVVWISSAGVAWAALAVVALLLGPAVGSLGLDRLVERIEGGPAP